jgi:inosose dehydratase
MIPRRSLLRKTGLALAAAFAAPALLPRPARAQAQAPAAAAVAAAPAKDSFVLGMAGYTFHKFALDPTLEMLRKVDVHYLCIKDFHLPLASTDAEIAAFHEKCRSFGVTGYGVGPIYMGSPEEVDRAFAYARRVGVKTLVGVPFKMVGQKRVASAELLKRIHDKVQEHDLRYAVHNHGPDMPELFPTAESAMELIGDLDKRVGLCLDIGHQLRDGRDPVKAVIAYADRLHDLHLKNVSAANQSGRCVELPRGLIDIPALVRALRQVGYRGVCSLEHEKDMDNPLAGIAECVGYFRGVLDATR